MHISERWTLEEKHVLDKIVELLAHHISLALDRKIKKINVAKYNYHNFNCWPKKSSTICI
jgi:hypothetical protein